MNTQFKKGVLELVVLLTIRKEDMYGYELVNEVNKVITVNEGTIYPLLKRLTNDKCFETYLRESTEGPPRKYYKLTQEGHEKLSRFCNDWVSISNNVNNIINHK